MLLTRQCLSWQRTFYLECAHVAHAMPSSLGSAQASSLQAHGRQACLGLRQRQRVRGGELGAEGRANGLVKVAPSASEWE